MANQTAAAENPVTSGVPLLELQGVTKRFGGLVAVGNVSLAVHRGEIFSIIGPNGAGKTTVFHLITGVLPPTSGTVRIAGQLTAGLRPHQIARLGVARTFQTTQVFAEKSVLENALVGRHPRVKTGLLQALLQTPAYRREEEEHRNMALRALQTVGLEEHAHELAGRLPTALQQRVAVAMALAGEPQLLLLDEPTGGLMEQEVADMIHLLSKIRDLGITVVLIEHKMRVVRQISDRIAVLTDGQKICEGTPEQVLNDERVVEAYLGTEESAAGIGA